MSIGLASANLMRAVYRTAYANRPDDKLDFSPIMCACRAIIGTSSVYVSSSLNPITDPITATFREGLAEAAVRLRRAKISPTVFSLLSTADLLTLGIDTGEQLTFAFLIAMRAASSPDSPWLDILTKFYNESEGM